MRRKILNIAAAVSLAFAIAVLVAWTRGAWGYGRPQVGFGTPAAGKWFVASNGRTLRLIRQHVTTRSDDAGDVGSGHRLGFLYVFNNGSATNTVRYGPHEPDKSFLGFAFDQYRFRRDYQFWRAGTGPLSSTFILDATTVAIPWWFLLVVSGLLPALAARTRLCDRGRWAHGRCLSCGYDLRATPERCPECGAVPTAARGTAA